jgi:predicted ATPase
VRNEARLLCLDEFQITDVADAMLVKRLFETLFAHGCTVIATSNRAPEELYKNGINRPVFLPFIDVLKARCVVHHVDEGQDHRLLGTLAQGVYHSPLGAAADTAIDAVRDNLCEKGERAEPMDIAVMMGRTLHVPLGAKQVAQFSFTELCERALGAADYIALAKRFPYVIVTDVPVMTFDQREKIRRFITLLDVLYEHSVRFICSAEAAPAKLFQMPASTPGMAAAADDGNTTSNSSSGEAVYDEQFASDRAVSRLIEMQSEEYAANTLKRQQQAGRS